MYLQARRLKEIVVSPSPQFAQISGSKTPRIVLTRPADGESAAFEASLIGAGFQVIALPLIEVAPLPFSPPSWEGYDWLFFTSKNAVKAVFSQLKEWELPNLPMACVGPVTEEALKVFGQQAKFVSPVHDAQSTAHFFAAAYALAGLRIFWPCGNLANPQLQSDLEGMGALVTAHPVYETRLRDHLTAQELAVFLPVVDLVVFTSPSAVQAFATCVVKPAHLSMEKTPIACLGPRTTQAALDAFGHVDIQAQPYTLAALSQAISCYFSSSTSTDQELMS